MKQALRDKWRLGAGFGVAMAFWLLTGVAMAGDLDGLLKKTADKDGYVAATIEETRRAEELFVRLLRGEREEDIQQDLTELGFILDQVQAGRDTLTVIRESEDRRTGKGLYVFRNDPTKMVLLQAPHRFKDLDTGTIVARIMEESGFAAAAWNTVPRWYDEDGHRVDADLSHTRTSHFNAFTRAFIRVHPGGQVAQLHGFDPDKRDSAAGRSASIVVSSGTKDPGSAATRAAACLKSMLRAEKTLLYPLDIQDLGATTNTNGAEVRSLGSTAFVHLEVSRDLRKWLRKDADLRRVVIDCLTGSEF
jgi:hypothetical protein